jgi:MFS family permease
MAHPTPVSRSLRRNVPLFYLVTFLRDFQIWIPVWVVFLTIEQGFSLTEVTFADAMFLIAMTLFEVPTGAFADRFGRSRSVALGALVYGVALGVFAVTTSFPILLASFLIWALGGALMSGADLALLYDSLKVRGEEAAYERHAGAGAGIGWAGAAVATVGGGPLAAAYGIEFTIWVGAAVAALAGLAAFLMVEPPYRTAHETPSIRRTLNVAIATAWHDRVVRWVMLVSAGLTAAFSSAHYLVQPYLLADGYGVGFVFSLLQVPQLLGGTIGSFAAYRLLGRFGDTRLLLGMAAAGAGAFLGASLVTTFGIFAFIPLVGAFQAAVIPVATGAVNRRVASEHRATILSIQSFTGSLVMAPVAVLVGAVSDSRGPSEAFAVLGLVAVVVLTAAALTWRPAREARPGAAESVALPGGGGSA